MQNAVDTGKLPAGVNPSRATASVAVAADVGPASANANAMAIAQIRTIITHPVFDVERGTIGSDSAQR
jgi:hypothetical protein